jgi:hypothetical protein
MADPSAAPVTTQKRGMRALFLASRISGALMVATLAFVIVVNFVFPTEGSSPTAWEWLGLAMFPFGVFVAYILAFRFGLLGGSLVIALLLGWWVYVGFKIPILVVAAIVAVPAILYVLHGVLSSERSRAGQPPE